MTNMHSMTGFGRFVLEFPDYEITAELHSVNHRFCDIKIHTPFPSHHIDEQLRHLIRENIRRGKCTLSISIENKGYETQLAPNWPLIQQYIDGLEQISDRFHIANDWRLTDLLKLENLFITSNETQANDVLETRIIDTAKGAIEDFLAMRITEGRALKDTISKYCHQLEQYLSMIENKAPEVKELYNERLKQSIRDFLGNQKILDKERLYMEVALYGDKCNIDEEITRLKSHLNQCTILMTEAKPVGRKFDFLIQEMNREINTIGSKAGHVEISQWVVEMKSELEKMREQVQNVE